MHDAQPIADLAIADLPIADLVIADLPMMICPC
jgi:hypothetical protein